MAMTDAQKRARDKYDKENMKQVRFKFHKKNDADILAKLDSVENKTGYIRDLIRKDIIE